MKGVLPWLDFSCLYKRFLSRFGCSSRPSSKYFFSSPHTISIHLSLSHKKLGRQSCWVACLVICVSGISTRPVLQGPLSGSRSSCSPTVPALDSLSPPSKLHHFFLRESARHLHRIRIFLLFE